MSENFAGNIIVNLASLPDFLRDSILKKRVSEFFGLPDAEKKEIVCNALEAGPGIPFPNFSRLLLTWLKVLAGLPEERREDLLARYVGEAARNPACLVDFNLDGILGTFLMLEEGQRRSIAGTLSRIIGRLEGQDKRRVLVMIPDSAKSHLGL